MAVLALIVVLFIPKGTDKGNSSTTTPAVDQPGVTAQSKLRLGPASPATVPRGLIIRRKVTS